MNYLKVSFLSYLIIISFGIIYVSAQNPADSIGISPYKVITVDLSKGRFSSYSLPFDVPFIIAGNVPQEIVGASLYISEIKNNERLLSKRIKRYEAAQKELMQKKIDSIVNVKNASLKGEKTETKTDSIKKTVQDSLKTAEKKCEKGGECKTCCNGYLAACWSSSLFTCDSMTDCGKKSRTFSLTVDPLPAFKRFQFCIVFQRTANALEKEHFTSLLRPMFKDAVVDFIKQDSNVDFKWINDSNSFNKVSDDISNLIVNYYYKNLSVDFSDKKSIITNYIHNNLLAKAKELQIPILNMLNKDSDYQRVIKKLKDDYGNTYKRYFEITKQLAEKHNQLKRTEANYKFTNDILLVGKNFEKGLDGNLIISNPLLSSTDRLTSYNIKNKQDFIDRYDAFIGRLSDLHSEIETANGNDSIGDIYTKFGIPEADRNLVLDKTKELITEFLKIKSHAKEYKSEYENLDSIFYYMQFEFWFSLPISIGVQGLTSTDFVTRGEWFITADLGFASINLQEPLNKKANFEIKPYVGVNFNLGAINRQAHYSILNCIRERRFDQFFKSCSFVAGITLRSIDDSKRYDDLWDTKSLLTGFGIRLTEGLRFAGGLAWFKTINQNTLLDETSKLQSHYYFSVSLDVDLKKWLKDFGTAFEGLKGQ